MISAKYGEVFLYESEASDIVAQLAITQDQYDNQCKTQSGDPYYRTCKFDPIRNEFIDFRKDASCESFITSRSTEAAYEYQKTAPRKEVVGMAYNMRRVSLLESSSYTAEFSDV